MEINPYKRGFDDDVAILQGRLAETTLLLEVLAKVNYLIGESKSFDDFCLAVLKILQDKFGFTHIHIGIKEEKEPHILRLITPEQIGRFKTMPVQHGIVGKAIRENRTVCVPDVTADSDYVTIHPDVKSELCVPLSTDGKVIGAINIETDMPQTFANYMGIIELIASNLGHSMKLAMLYQTEEYFHRLVDHMNEGVWVGDADENTVYTNLSLQEMTGFGKEELCNKTSYDLVDKDSGEIVKKEIEKRKKGIASHYEARFITKSGNTIPVLINAAPFGNTGSTMATITDLRTMKATEKRLLQTERFLASITQHCFEAIVGMDANGILQSWNVGAERIFGFKAEEMIGLPLDKRFIPEDRIVAGEPAHLLNETKTKGFVRNFETIRLHKNGKPINISLTLSAIRDNNNNITGISAIYRDISAQKKWEQELQDRFEKMQDAYREMGKQRRYLDYLGDMIMMSGSGGSVKQLENFIVNAIVMISRVDAATLRLMDETGEKLLLAAQSGLGEEWWSKKVIPYSGSLLEKAVKKNSPLKILDILNDPAYISPSLARKSNLRSALVLPLKVKDTILGSITLYLSHEGNLSLLDDEFIAVFAKQAALAIKLAS
ncbi:MEKHLA domain-containing protein [Candidatus Peregrinibacteria bacterium]|nr:MEKHLA domain-containing protein [Candidatus Peregrinibacteria bacterium]